MRTQNRLQDLDLSQETAKIKLNITPSQTKIVKITPDDRSSSTKLIDSTKRTLKQQNRERKENSSPLPPDWQLKENHREFQPR